MKNTLSLEGKLFFPRENFHFPKSDIHQKSLQDFGSPDRGKGKLSKGKEWPESFFISEHNLFSDIKIAFSHGLFVKTRFTYKKPSKFRCNICSTII